jgi:membrane protease subunit (stomatin/prohibitin family)
VLKTVAPEMEKYGIEVTKLRIENISLPPEVEAALDKGSSARVVGDMGRFTAYQTANAIEQAAKNPGGGGLAAGGMGMGMGFAMGNQMAGQMAAGQAAAAGAGGAGGPPPLPGAQPFYVAIGGQQAGPFDMATLRLHAQTGKLTNGSLVWRQGMATWLKAGEVPELAELFVSAGPPPLPPGA